MNDTKNLIYVPHAIVKDNFLVFISQWKPKKQTLKAGKCFRDLHFMTGKVG